MRAGIDAEDEKRRLDKLNKKDDDSEEVKQRLERNRKDFELQQQLTESLSSKNL